MEQDFLDHFVPQPLIPELAEGSSLLDIYRVLNTVGARGFIATKAGHRLFYLDSVELGNAVLEERIPFSSSLGDALDRLTIEKVPISDAVKEEGDWSRLGSIGTGVIAAVEIPSRLGWVRNHEFVLATSVGKPQFVCANGHTNASPDHGYCSQCPALLLSVKAQDTSLTPAASSAE